MATATWREWLRRFWGTSDGLLLTSSSRKSCRCIWLSRAKAFSARATLLTLHADRPD
jgi:hypothetical protein